MDYDGSFNYLWDGEPLIAFAGENVGYWDGAPVIILMRKSKCGSILLMLSGIKEWV